MRLAAQLGQLGVDTQRAALDGALFNNPPFFGTSISEVVSSATGGWNGNRAAVAFSTGPWFHRGGISTTVDGGEFASAWANGGEYNYTSHRTILLGY
ncbi:hypothetical protein FWG76_00275 [Candidatus Saccharibacteria bacterium]|nr:hypothetical protein [Candidatus Saccharibacteria bacterium]